MYLYLTDEFIKLNEKAPNIHYGGCVVFAEKLYNILVNLGKRPKIVILSNTPKSVKHYVKHFPFISENTVDIRHAVIKVDGIYIDNNGFYCEVTEIIHQEDRKNYKEVATSINELRFINDNMINWNDRFDRVDIEIVNKTFKEIEKYITNNLVL